MSRLVQQEFQWFQKLFGVPESNIYSAVQANFKVDMERGTLTSLANNREFHIGKFSTPTLNSLSETGKIKLRMIEKDNTQQQCQFSYSHTVQGDVLPEHAKHPGALFQAASQFNCLEFSTWKKVPEHGVTAYASDHTQGPACALACAAGTVYRNYFADVAALSMEGNSTHSSDYVALGQRQDRQINNLDLLEAALHNAEEQYFNIHNGYTFTAHESNLARLTTLISASKASTLPPEQLSYEQLRGLVKIGLQTGVGVDFQERFTAGVESVQVTQAYCSALSCAYSGVQNQHWEALARLVLEANYEATLWAAVLNAVQEYASSTSLHPQTAPSAGNNQQQVFLTFLGGGVFGNDPEWICDAIGRALAVMQLHEAPIQVHISHFRAINADWAALVDEAFHRHVAILQQQCV